MTAIKTAKFANDVAKKIKEAGGTIPTQRQLFDLTQEVTKRFDAIVEGRVCDTCCEDLPTCPCCLISVLRDEVATESEFNVAYLEHLAEISWEEADGSIETFENKHTLAKIYQHMDVKLKVQQHLDEIVGKKFDSGLEIIEVEVDGEFIDVKFAPMDEEYYVYGGDYAHQEEVSIFLAKTLDLEDISTRESGMQPDYFGLGFAAWGW